MKRAAATTVLGGDRAPFRGKAADGKEEHLGYLLKRLQHSINTILRRLEGEGSLERKPHPDNRRVDCWYISDLGRAQMQKARAAADPVWDNMLAPLGPDEVAALRGLLKRCIEGLEHNRTTVETCSPPVTLTRSSRRSSGVTGRNRQDPVPKGKRP